MDKEDKPMDPRAMKKYSRLEIPVLVSLASRRRQKAIKNDARALASHRGKGESPLDFVDWSHLMCLLLCLCLGRFQD